MQALADWLMQTVVRSAPKARADWAQAMQAEYAELESGRLNWALGCWLAVNGWKLRADLVYFAALGLVSALLPNAWPFVGMWLFVAVHAWAPSWIFYVTVMLGPALVCFGFGAYRPSRVVVTVTAVQISLLVEAWMAFASMGHPWRSPMDMVQNLNIMNLPFVFGLSIWVVTDLACGWAGAALRHRFVQIFN